MKLNPFEIDILLEVAGADSSSIRDRVLKALEVVELAHQAGHYPQECSGGEQQRGRLLEPL